MNKKVLIFTIGLLFQIGQLSAVLDLKGNKTPIDQTPISAQATKMISATDAEKKKFLTGLWKQFVPANMSLEEAKKNNNFDQLSRFLKSVKNTINLPGDVTSYYPTPTRKPAPPTPPTPTKKGPEVIKEGGPKTPKPLKGPITEGPGKKPTPTTPAPKPTIPVPPKLPPKKPTVPPKTPKTPPAPTVPPKVPQTPEQIKTSLDSASKNAKDALNKEAAAKTDAIRALYNALIAAKGVAGDTQIKAGNTWLKTLLGQLNKPVPQGTSPIDFINDQGGIDTVIASL